MLLKSKADLAANADTAQLVIGDANLVSVFQFDASGALILAGCHIGLKVNHEGIQALRDLLCVRCEVVDEVAFRLRVNLDVFELLV